MWLILLGTWDHGTIMWLILLGPWNNYVDELVGAMEQLCE